MSSFRSLSLRALSKRPATLLQPIRSLATAVEVPTPIESSVESSTPAESVSTPIISRSFPISTVLPTPYHPFVHVPLLSFLPASLRSTESTPPAVVPLPSILFNSPSRPSLLHKLVISHLASLRTGNASTKNRSEVNYSGKKIRPQKGTGKARLGSRGSPMLTGGGRSFGPTTKGPDGWNRKVNRKEERVGLRVGLSDKWRSGDLCVIDRLGMTESRTRLLNERLECRNWGDALFILAKERTEEMKLEKEMFEFASRNLDNLTIIDDATELGIWEIVKSKKIIIELGAVDEVIHRLDPEGMYNQGNEEDWEEDEEELAEEDMALELEAALAATQPSL